MAQNCEAILCVIKAVFSFLTRFPVGKQELVLAAKHTYLFPVAAICIGFFAYIAGIFFSFFMPVALIALLTLLTLYALTGLLHLDGLTDFLDGAMAPGSKQKKLAAMKDLRLGVAGLFGAVFVLVAIFFTIETLFAINQEKIRSPFGLGIPFYTAGAALMLSELGAKLSMSTCLAVGRPIDDKGMGALFIRHSTAPKYVLTFAITVLFAILVAGFHFAFVCTGTIIGLLISRVAEKKFGGVNGDVCGAANEIGRVTTLLILVVVP